MAVLGASSLRINSATLGSQTGSAPMFVARAWVRFNGTTSLATISNNESDSSDTTTGAMIATFFYVDAPETTGSVNYRT
jgi:hypothetical protein